MMSEVEASGRVEGSDWQMEMNGKERGNEERTREWIGRWMGMR